MSETDELNWSENGAPPERWAPLGAVADSPSTTSSEGSKTEFIGYPTHEVHNDVNLLMDENEQMSNSLLSLTSHFAQVQFRLKQIIEGPEEQKSERLKELEQFAERGIPDVKSCVLPRHSQECEDTSDEEYKKKLTDKQKEMICELKNSLADLESYAYENGFAEEIPTSKRLEKQDVVIQEIKRKLQISNLDNLASLSSTELRECVDEAIGQIVHPAKVKEKQVEQLRTQVVDLERFVDFLQAEVTSAQKEAQEQRRAPGSKTRFIGSGGAGFPPYSSQPTATVRTQGTGSSDKSDPVGGDSNDRFSSRLKHIVSVLHLFIISELGCASRASEIRRNDMKEKSNQPHYGDMLAEMQMSIDALVDISEQVIHERDNSIFTDCDYLSDEETYISESKELTQCVRKRFSISLKKLIEHGAVEKSSSQALVPFGGCASRNSVLVKSQPVHAWKIILRYYELKDGHSFNEAPARRLANAFGIDDLSNSETTVKQSLLSGIGHIVETHTPYQRSDDSHYKAFISLALNQKKLVPWLRQIFRTSAIIDQYYQPWSYITKTGFEDVFCAMNKLKLYEFNLPVDLAVKQFSNIRDAF